MDTNKIERINQLAKINKERELTKEEKEEQNKLRQEYIRSVRGSLKSHLDNIKFID